MKLVVTDVTLVAHDIVRIRLANPTGEPCDRYGAGAHLRVEVPCADGGNIYRRYSLTGEGDPAPCYEIAVLRVAGGAGSNWMHRLAVGDEVEASIDNAFELLPAPDGHLLIAGGIGITPILSMARRLTKDGAPFELHYAASGIQRMAFRDEVTGMGPGCHLYAGEGRTLRDCLPDILARASERRRVYVCGPLSLIEDVIDIAVKAGWAREQVHHELFDGCLAQQGDSDFEVRLRQSALTIPVRAEQSLLDALLEAGVEPLHDCKRGECGMCLTPVIEGIPDHRDHYLSESERARNDSICVCISRAKSPLLVLDL